MQNKKQALYKPFSAEEIAVFCEQVSLILGSGVTLFDGMEALCEDYAQSPNAAILKQMDDKMKETGSFYQAIESNNLFPEYMVGMVKVGEEAGKLDTVMTGLYEHYIRESQIKRSISSAALYPLTLITVMAVIVLVLVSKVLPIFNQALKNLSGELPTYAVSMMEVGRVTGIVVFALSMFVLISITVCVLLYRKGYHRAFFDQALRSVAPIRRVLRMINAQRFASIMSMLLSSGFPIEDALELIPHVFKSEADKTIFAEVSTQVAQGESFATAIEKTGLFDMLYMRMIRVGYASGQAEVAMKKVSDIYMQEIDDSLERLISMIEPILVAVLTTMIGAILISVMMPLASMLSIML